MNFVKQARDKGASSWLNALPGKTRTGSKQAGVQGCTKIKIWLSFGESTKQMCLWGDI